MRLLCLYGIGQRTETFGCLLPSSRVLRTPWQIFIPRISGTILNGCLTLWCSNSFLPSPLFQRLTSFASRLNCQLTPFVSWKPEPGVWAVNAFSLCWTALKFYAFPPFSILGKVLVKIQQDGATGMLVTPFWSTQPWFPQLLELLTTTHNCSSPRKTFSN